MNFTRPGESFILLQFREFYRELMRLVSMIKAGSWVYLPDQGPEAGAGSALETGPAPAEPGPEGTVGPPAAGDSVTSTAVSRRLLSLFEQQTLAAYAQGGTFGAEIYKEAQYVMVALADEVLLNLEWRGRQYWVSNLLESQIFKSHVAGELIFQKLDRLLQGRDPVYGELAAIYLLALSLGFKGKFRDLDDRGWLARYRKELFSFVFQRNPDLLNESKQLFPEAYTCTIREGSRRKLPNPRLWLGVLGLVILIYIAISHGLWISLTSNLNKVLDEISRIERDLSSKQ